MLATLVLLVCAAAETPDPVAVAMSAAADPALALPSLGPNRAGVYRIHVEKLRNKPTDAELCTVMDDAALAGPTIATLLAKRLDEVIKDPAALEAFVGQVTKLQAELPGIGFDVGDTGIATTRDYTALAEIAPPGAKALLLAAVPFATDPPQFLEARKDKLCLWSDKGDAALDKLTKAWASAPKCVRNKLDAELERAIRRTEYVMWFCDDAEKGKAAAEQFAKSLDALTYLGGKVPAAQIRKNVAAPEAHFGATPPP